MGGADVAGGREVLIRAGIPSFDYPDTAARAFQYMWRYSENLRGLYETPGLASQEADSPAQRAEATAIINKAMDEGRTLLTEFEAKQLMASYGIPTVPTFIATTVEEAAKRAEEIGFPVVLKLHSETVTHKTDVGGVKLNLANVDEVRAAFSAIQKGVAEKASAADFGGVTVQPMIKLDGYELIIGSSIDSQFGPVLLFGTGGQLVEVFKDRALGLPPLNTTLARRMMENTKIFHALQGVRGRAPVDIAALENLLVRFSRLVAENPRIKEIDINPLLASAENLIALDARVLLHEGDIADEDLPTTAIRPYPAQYVSHVELEDGTALTVRPIRPEDEPLMVQFHSTLSERSVFQRYAQPLALSQRTAHERLIRVCYNDYARELALLATRRDAGGKDEILGIARLTRDAATPDARFALLVSDTFQGHGLGRELLGRLLEVAREEKVQALYADMFADNSAMRHICEELGFGFEPAGDMLRAQITL
jgi:acetyltransferase